MPTTTINTATIEPSVSFLSLLSSAASAASGFLGTWLPRAIAVVIALLLLRIAIKFVQRLIFFLGKDEQLVIVKLTDTEVRNGPGTQLVSPFVKSATKRKGLLLEPLSYAKV